ncbi:protein Dok-7 isoform X2 [Lepisosteus oculatus]|uniref:protein Dok-7 isoform X2 n=1 Tax=Lepisosteus oculatus TaxID=7918 RepID=UPI00073FD86C|nr:PREDICTED: protein Dok-7 isoform X13 [Lepisosteus oculatus]
MTDSVVVEGQVKYRDGKKWKSRWVALRKPSPVADCLLMLVYKDKSDKTKGHKERHSITLEDICGLEPGLSYEGVSYTLAIICLSETVMLGFESRDTMYAWDIRIRYSLGEVHRFNVAVLPGTKLETGPATLHLCNDLLVIVRDIPPAIIGQWKLSDLRRYGAVPNGFVFEGGTRCGYWAGVFFLSCAEGEQISFLFDCVVRGISPSRGPFGLRPALPDPNANPAYMEDRVSHEALELEKRLSLLSHSSRQSSTASSSSYSTSGTLGDDRSLSSSSSDTSHSDTSIGSRLAIWPEPSISSAPLEPHSLPAAKTVLHGEEKLHVEAMRGTRPPPKPPRSRKLQEIGRQSSSDSGIATGSHSSYSGSFSSYTGSLDICHGDEFGSLLSLPLNLASDQSWCTCQHGETQRVLGSEYQVPSSLRHLYDTPRSLLQAAASREAQSKSPDTSLPKDEAALSLLTSITDTKGATPELSSDRRLATSSSHESSRDSDETYVDLIPRWSAVQHPEQVRVPRSSEVVPSAGVSTDPCEICSPHPGVSRALFAACPICGGLKGTTLSHSGVLSMPAIPDKKPKKKDEKRKTDLAYEIMEGRGTEKPAEWDESSRYELMASYGHQKIFHETEGATSSLGTSGTLQMHREQSSLSDSKGSYELMTSTIEMPKRCEVTSGEYWGMSAISTDVQVPEKLRGEGVTYVNIPVSPTSKKQLHYMELELQEPGSGVRGGGSTKYAQIDITATETAHKVGTQHAQFREERLQELEQKKKVWKQKLMKTENPDLCHQMDTKWESGFSVELNCERDGAQLQPSYKRAPAKKTQRKRCKTLTPKSKRQKSNTALEWDERVLKSIWGREGKSGPFPCIFLPVAEDEFLEDMLADNPRYKSTSQQKPMEYWEKAAADLPVYQGPWKPSRSQNPPLW